MSPFSIADARRRGIGRDALAAAVARGDVRRAFRGAYLYAAEPDTFETRAAAVSLVRPGGVVVYLRSAAWLYGVDAFPPGSDATDWPLQITVPSGATPPRVPGCQGFQAPFLAGDTVRVRGMPVTTPLRTALDCGRLLPPLEALATVDQILRRYPSLHGPFLDRIGEFAGRRGKRQLDFVGRVADPRVESPGESWSRGVLVDAGFPVPEPQIEIRDPVSGRVVARLDNGFRQHRVGVEYDGQEFHDSAEQIRHDLARRAEVERYGWRLVIVRREHIWRDHRSFLDATLVALCARGFDAGMLAAPLGRVVDRRVLAGRSVPRAA